MSERSFFDWRNALPGYTVILIVLAINWVPLVIGLNTAGVQATFGAVLAFLTLVSGSAIGFLLSQVWWWRYQSKGAHYYYGGTPNELIELTTKYGLRRPNNIEDRIAIQNVLAVYGYVAHYEKEKNQEIVRYTTRRWDQFHAFSATKTAILLGIAVGLFSRFVSQFFILNWNIRQLLQYMYERYYDVIPNLSSDKIFEKILNTVPDSIIIETIILTIIILGAIILYYLCDHASLWVLEQYSRVSHAIIRQSHISRWKLQSIFPKEYFDPNWDEA